MYALAIDYYTEDKRAALNTYYFEAIDDHIKSRKNKKFIDKKNRKRVVKKHKRKKKKLPDITFISLILNS